MTEEKIPVVVTTERAPFFGFIEPSMMADKTVTLSNVRHCLYWSREIGGVVGLASVGPNSNCRISASAAQATIQNVTAVFVCTPESASAWEGAPVVGR